MKKVLFGSMLTLGLVSLASCSNEDAPVAAGPDGVTFSLRLPGEMGSRGSFGDGDAAGDRAELDNLQWTVYEVAQDGTPAIVFSEGRGAFGASQTEESVTIALAKGKTYQVVFYADDKDNTFATYADGKVSVDYDKAASNTAAEDVFIGKSSVFTVSGAHVETVTLTRPFAQLNWGTDDKAAAAIAPLINSETAPLSAAVSVTAGLFGSMDVLTGEVSDPVSESIQFDAVLLKDAPAQTFPVQKDDATAAPYALVAMNYLLTGDGTIDCTLGFNNGLSPVEVSSAPVKVNFRTNIYGSLLTSPGIFNILVNNTFLGNLNNEVKPETVEELVSALASPTVTDIEINKDFDLSDAQPEALSFDTPKTLTIADDKTITLGDNVLTANNGLTIIGGKLSNFSETPGTRAGKVKARANAKGTKNIIIINEGDLVLDGVELINDTTWHWHGDGINNAAVTYWGNVNVTIRNSRILSGGFTVCGMRNAVGTVLIENSYLESNSTNANNGQHWAYATRLIGTKTTVKNCEVKGIQGALSIEGESNEAVVDGGKYYTVNTPGRTDAFYAVYATAGAKVTILDGEFSGANKHSGLLTEEGETSCVVSGDNDTGMTVGAIVIRGGKFSGRAYNHNTKKIYQPEAPLSYQLSTDPNFKWEVK